MYSNLSYNGEVTIITKMGHKTISNKYYNNGTNLLFEVYARALTGQNVSSLIPAYIDIVRVQTIDDTTTYTQCLRDMAPVIVTYVDKVRANEKGYTYGVPFTRVEAILTKNMFTSEFSDGDIHIQLKTSSENLLASLHVDGLYDGVNNMTDGTQMIVVWDLYVTNKQRTTTEGGNI